jgi:trehalose-phosphatase
MTPGDVRGSPFGKPTLPRAPAATADMQELFPETNPRTATKHFVQAQHQRTPVPNDSYMPGWGYDPFFNQPSAGPEEMPPSHILSYGQELPSDDGQERARNLWKNLVLRRSKGKSGRAYSQSASTDKKFTMQWNIVPALQGNGGLVNAVKAANETGTMGDIIWVGTVGFPTDSLSDDIKNEINERLDSKYDALPVYVGDSEFNGHYLHFCKIILWPVLHYQIPDHAKSKAYEDHSYKHYVKLNEAFAEQVVSNYKRGDVIWIHDYHLLLVPQMIRRKLPDAKIGFFLHTAFPSSEVFRCLAMRNQLLEGMLGATMIGFQCQEYCNHFLTTTSRLLRVPVTKDGVDMEDHFVNVVSFAIGLDPKSLDEARHEPEVRDWIRVMEERYKDKLLIVARDRLDQVGGVRQKLLAFELFLNKNPDLVNHVVLIQVATPATEHEELASTVSHIVARIDTSHSTLAHQPLVFLRQDIEFPQYLALLSVADVLMITSLREGMSLAGHEYILCQDGTLSSKKHGPIILSEFTGAASVFDNKELTVNPWDYKQIVGALNRALELTAQEKEERYTIIRQQVFQQTGESWMKELAKCLDMAYVDRYRRDLKTTPRLSSKKLLERYRKAHVRLFFVDYEGTLAGFDQQGHHYFNSPQRVIDTLNDLISAGNNIVYVMSGRMPEELDKTFARVPGLGIIAENGWFVRPHGSGEWKARIDVKKMKRSMADVKSIMRYYQDRIGGAIVEETHCSIIFRYDKVKEQDQDSAARLAGDCADQINDSCAGLRIHAVPRDKSVLIAPVDLSKALAAKQIFEENWASEKNCLKHSPDFLFVAGDDREDEAIFHWANNLEKEGKLTDVTTVTVGNKCTEAMATLVQGKTGMSECHADVSKKFVLTW